ncbi:uncharacterized protein BKCO1_1400028 [Diplodia corticola]|uniref:Uncharacterized protein n=1 Tax=Diplodia corticola TaxID=236234 RepID=A0A1J9R5J4_9PEZI|nr:uncharacterized protein BKCO1_1400028 [Diplodia corticola]OJD35880.1 hypothetical protein BKCO1_1400028 [Diplodia corticola]
MTTSLALLPAHPQQPSPAVQPPQPAHAAPRRPKLSLNTSTAQVRTFGKGSSLRLETLSAVSPTARNTFSNGYEPQTLSAESKADTPSSASTFSSSTSASSCSSLASSLGGESAKIPYKLPHNVQSILANSPLPPVHRHRTMAARRMFPATKRVSFRANLTEDIVTTKFTMAHSDIESSSSTISSLASDSNTSEADSDVTGPVPGPTAAAAATTTLPSRTAAKLDLQLAKPAPAPAPAPVLLATAQHHSTERPRCQKRESPSDSESDSDTCPATPVAGRRKRRREWKWTLGPIDGQQVDAKLVREEDEMMDDSDPDQDRLTCQQRFAQYAGRRQSDASEEGSVSSPTSSVEGERR